MDLRRDDQADAPRRIRLILSAFRLNRRQLAHDGRVLLSDPALDRRPVLERPTISFVFPVHDPDYGGGLLARTQRHLDTLIALANRNRLLSEIIIVEWNPRQERPPFRDSLHWPEDLGHVSLRFIEVPADIHRRLPNADRIPIFEYIAKNAGLRRARGRFLLATNPDLFFSPALIRWLARTPLSTDTFYRVDRRDLSEEIPADLSLAAQLRFCSRHVGQVHAFFGSYPRGETDIVRRLKDEYDRRAHDPTGTKRRIDTPGARLIWPSDRLHRNAAGDFFLMEREWWHRLRGYPELYTHAHIDAILCWVASSAGLVQEILPPRCHLFHQAHDRASRAAFPQTDWKPWYKRYEEAIHQDPLHRSAAMVINPEDWGLANEVLPEWQANPQLVQVQAITGREEVDTSLASRAWRITSPIRRALTSFPGLRRTVGSGQHSQHAESHRQSKGNEHGLVKAKREKKHKVPASTTGQDAPPTPTLARLLSKRFRELEPLRVFNVPADEPRVSLVTDGISTNSLIGGTATALVMAALLARHLGARLRVITLTEPPEPDNVGAVFTSHQISWSADLEFVHVGRGRKEDVPVADDEVFLTASWRSTRSVLPIVDPRRLVYLLQEDERVFSARGDDRLRCVETLSDSSLRFVVNGRLLFDHLTQGPNALSNVRANGVWFEPAFAAFERELASTQSAGKARQFFFYARPDDPRTLYWRGLEAIGAALEENVLDPAQWTFHFAGGDVDRLELPRGVRPNIVTNPAWSNYVGLIRRMDVGLCLMDAPHPSYVPLELAAAGAVVVTNQQGDNTPFARRIIGVEPSIGGLKRGIAEAAARSPDRRGPANVDGDGHINRDWEAALAPVLEHLYPNRRLR
jgi:hypothetical protein